MGKRRGRLKPHGFLQPNKAENMSFEKNTGSVLLCIPKEEALI
jgi:hypothetical protein